MSEPKRDKWAEWLLCRRHGGDPEKYETQVKGLHPLRDRVLDKAGIIEGDVVLDVGTGDGLIAFGALDKVGESGKVIFGDISEYLLNFCQTMAQRLDVIERCEFLCASADDLSPVADGSVDVVTVRSVLIYVSAKQQAFQEFYRVLKPKGRLSLFEPINRFGHPEPPNVLWGYDVTPVQDLAHKVRAVYERIQPPERDPMLDFDERDLLSMAEIAGFAEVQLEYKAVISPNRPHSWDEMSRRAGNPNIPTLEEAISQALTSQETKRFTSHLRPLVETGQGKGGGASVFLRAVKH